ncbi:hypothetical protein ABZ477_12585 [Microbacterium sp. NPDC019599]|uniref:hypothetical protein n=1 Tax=Microbacterium sp. NPDC019599 TaxID=3154690 RepID=UPI0033D4C9E0
MSNYLAVVVSARHEKRLRAWLDRRSEPDEVWSVPLRARRTLYIVSAGVQDSLVDAGFFRGHLVSHEHEVMVFGAAGWRAAPPAVKRDGSEAVGEFLRFSWTRDRVDVSRDFFGNARLLHTEGPGFAAFSDSMLVLASLRRALGAPVTASEEVLTARAAPSQIAGQQISPETMIDEIAFAPPWARIGVDVPRLHVDVAASTATRMLGGGRPLDEREVLRRTASAMTRTVSTLSVIPGWAPVLHLSGGLDSRAVFASMVESGNLRDFAYINRTRFGDVTDRDNTVARALAAGYGLPASDVDDDAAWREPRPVDGLRLWGASLAGVYDGLGPLGPRRRRSREFELFGLGAGAHKGGWGWCDFGTLAERASHPGTIRDALVAQLDLSAEGLGVEPSAPNASELYYFGYRNGIHSGAEHIGLHMTGVAPLQNVEFARLGHSQTPDGSFYGVRDGILSLTALLSPEAAVFEYDRPRHDWTLSRAGERQSELGGPLTDGERKPYTVCGSPDAVPQGPTRLALRLAEAAGMPDSADCESALAYSESNLELLSGDLAGVYRDVLANARWRLGRSGNDIFGAELPLARTMMLGILRPVA